MAGPVPNMVVGCQLLSIPSSKENKTNKQTIARDCQIIFYCSRIDSAMELDFLDPPSSSAKFSLKSNMGCSVTAEPILENTSPA